MPQEREGDKEGIKELGKGGRKKSEIRGRRRMNAGFITVSCVQC